MYVYLKLPCGVTMFHWVLTAKKETSMCYSTNTYIIFEMQCHTCQMEDPYLAFITGTG